MTKFKSISFLLSVITGLSVVLLVTVFTLSAKDAFYNKQDASEMLADAVAMQDVLAVKTQLRAEQGMTSTEFETPVLDALILKKIAGQHSEASAALRTALEDLKKHPETTADAGKAFRAGLVYEKLAAEMATALKTPLAQRHPTLGSEWTTEVGNLVAKLDDISNLLSSNIESRDRFVSEMMKINRIFWNMRSDAGLDRRYIAQDIVSGTRLPPARIQEIAEADGRISAPWMVIQGDLRLPFIPEQIKTAVAGADALYFKRYRATRAKISKALTQDQNPGISGLDWLMVTAPAIDSVTNVARTAIDQTTQHLAEQVSVATAKFYLAISLMIVAIVLGILSTIIVVFRIIRPLREIAETMRIVAHGDLAHKIPFKTRQDEIGSFARSLKTFRENAREKQIMESELLCNQMARETAEASNRIKSEFLANMSHELRTPLNAVIGFSDIMKQKLFGPLNPQYEEYSVLIHESGQLLLNLVSDILDIAKIEAGKFSLDIQPVNLTEAVASCVRLIKRRADDRHITVRTDLPIAPVTFDADPRAFKQMLLNLLSNAVKFTGEGGQVAITGKISGELLRITVSDNGIGIPASALSRIGHAFEQASNDPTRAREGTGLGLALVRALAAQHGGNFMIDSAEQVGTAVTIELPMSQNARAAA